MITNLWTNDIQTKYKRKHVHFCENCLLHFQTNILKLAPPTLCFPLQLLIVYIPYFDFVEVIITQSISSSKHIYKARAYDYSLIFIISTIKQGMRRELHPHPVIIIKEACFARPNALRFLLVQIEHEKWKKKKFSNVFYNFKSLGKFLIRYQAITMREKCRWVANSYNFMSCS